MVLYLFHHFASELNSLEAEMEDSFCYLNGSKQLITFGNRLVLKFSPFHEIVRIFHADIIHDSRSMVYAPCQIHYFFSCFLVIRRENLLVVGYIRSIGSKSQHFRKCVKLSFPSILYSYHFSPFPG